MPPKGKWAQGITPRHFTWIIQDRLAICERPGGYAANHRKVRRQEEIIWIREQGFSPVISIIPATHNLHNYDELSVTWQHRPFPTSDQYPKYLREIYTEIKGLLDNGNKVLVHFEEVNDRLAGLMAGYVVWTGMVPEQPKAIFLLEQLTGRQISPVGREIVSVAARLTSATGPASR